MNAMKTNCESAARQLPIGVAAALRPHGSSTPAPNDASHWSETLRDGTHVLVRPIRKEDAELERTFIDGLSEQSRRQRFLGSVHASDALIRQLTEIDPDREMAFVALVHRDGEKHFVGVSRYSSSVDGKDCECAIAVTDEWQGRGLGNLLMRHLIARARERGICALISIDPASNQQMRELAHELGFVGQRDPDDASQTIYRLVL